MSHHLHKHESVRVLPFAIQCEKCNRDIFQPLRGDSVIVTDDRCTVCNGTGAAPIPPAEVGL